MTARLALALVVGLGLGGAVGLLAAPDPTQSVEYAELAAHADSLEHSLDRATGGGFIGRLEAGIRLAGREAALEVRERALELECAE